MDARLQEDALYNRECPQALFEYLKDLPISYLTILVPWQVLLWLLAKMTLNCVHNTTKNRDPLATTPATVSTRIDDVLWVSYLQQKSNS